MKRITLAALITLALITLATANAQEYPLNLVRDAIAIDLDATVIDCPKWATGLEFPTECYRLPVGVELHQLQLDSFVRRMTDVQWRTPWNANESGTVGREFSIDGDVRSYAIGLFPEGQFGTIAVVLRVD
jgi:hypothetical protein